MGLYRILFYGGLTLAVIFLVLTVVLFFVLKIPKVFGDLTGRTQRKSIEAIQKSGYEAKSKQEAIKEETSRITVRNAADTGSDNLKKPSGRGGTAKMAASSRMEDDESTELLKYTGAAGNDEKTDVLSYTEDSEKTDILGSGAGSGNDEKTDILSAGSGEEATDILSDDEKTDILTSDEEKTDVLTSDDEKTDVLTSDDEEKTDVLTSPAATTSGRDKYADDRIIGNYSPEETGVLRSMGESPAPDANRLNEKITVVYDVAIIHTSESI